MREKDKVSEAMKMVAIPRPWLPNISLIDARGGPRH